ncbi:CheR family methyltransferase [Campylobacter suis]|uniref:Chemotaxis protein methyltransferase Cher2 n=1 Tax=Campylobacter suis TaxID=2790657 RepID=A0ABM8Q1C4_9BACT|nr:CheR family methyltransferase [Campylobacter suis]CAD7286568.1 Chemotaxis protein methyltransferase Cher2 [Campylobacter suis]
MFFNKPEIVAGQVVDTPEPKDMENFNEFIKNIRILCGVDLESKRDITLKRLTSFAKNNNISTFKDIVSLIRTNYTLRQDILNLITVNETYFYRELPQLKDVINYARDLGGARILCAPCSTGDEVYSLAMLAVEMGIEKGAISIVGIDINSEAIKHCQGAHYNSRSIHRLDDFQKSRFFVKLEDEKFEIKKQALCKCEFKVLNVFDDALFALGKFDIILSRNMMIYFDDEFRLKCVERLHRMLGDHGRFYAGHADLVPYTPLYEKRFSGGTTYYAKV